MPWIILLPGWTATTPTTRGFDRQPGKKNTAGIRRESSAINHLTPLLCANRWQHGLKTTSCSMIRNRTNAHLHNPKKEWGKQMIRNWRLNMWVAVGILTKKTSASYCCCRFSTRQPVTEYSTTPGVWSLLKSQLGHKSSLNSRDNVPSSTWILLSRGRVAGCTGEK